MSTTVPPFPDPRGLRQALLEALRPPSLGRRSAELLGAAVLVALLFWFTLRDGMLTSLIAGIALLHEAAVVVTATCLGLRRRANTWMRDLTPEAPGTEAWREALVALSGPIAGLAVAIALMAQDRYGLHPVYYRDGYVVGLFNGFMLLPVFPLDGGRFFHTLFFARCPSKGVLFRLGAVMVLILGGVYFNQVWPLVFALVPLYAFKSCLTLELLAQTLRLRSRGEMPSDELLVDELSKAFPGEREPAKVAAKALRLKVLIARRPPSLVTAALLVGLYVAVCGAAIAVIWFPGVLV